MPTKSLFGPTSKAFWTADPRLVPDARTIPEISYREAAELAYFGGKGSAPENAAARSSGEHSLFGFATAFAPEKPGTKISQKGKSIGGGVKALTAISRTSRLISLAARESLAFPMSSAGRSRRRRASR